MVFQSATAEAAVCSHCQSLLVRRDVNVEAIGQMAVLPPDCTPLQIGSRGVFEGKGFTLLGRIRVLWDDGSWNEWFVEFADQTRGWLGEAQGFCMILKEYPVKEVLPPRLEGFKAEQTISINGVFFKVTDAKPVSCLGGEGELPEAVPLSERWLSVDLERADGAVGTLEKGAQGWRFFQGKNASHEELGWQNLRPVPGWDAPLVTTRNQTDALSCPSCGGVVNVKAAGVSMSAVCSHCQSILDTSNASLQLLQKASEKRTLKPAIPLGTRGKWEGVEWEVLGFMERRDSWAPWIEYLLYNPFHGFRWLTEFEGQWTLVDRLLKAPASSGGLTYEGRSYRLYADENTSVTYVEGEFYWKIKRGEQSRVADFISPPYILSRETYVELNEVTWSAGRYVEGPKILEAFGQKRPGANPVKGPVSSLQPNPHEESWRTLKPLVWKLLLALIIVQIISSSFSGGAEAFHHSYFFDRSMPDTANVVTEPFELKKQGRVNIEAFASGVDNSWFAISASLINQETGDSYDADVSVEYYHGYDSDGYWSEGGSTAETSIPAVPPGTYTLSLSVEADAKINKSNFSVGVTGGKTYWSNLLLAIFVLLLWPILAWYRKHRFESKRWLNSGNLPPSPAAKHSAPPPLPGAHH